MRLYYFYFMPRAIYILKINKKKAAEAASKITKSELLLFILMRF